MTDQMASKRTLIFKRYSISKNLRWRKVWKIPAHHFNGQNIHSKSNSQHKYWNYFWFYFINTIYQFYGKRLHVNFGVMSIVEHYKYHCNMDEMK